MTPPVPVTPAERNTTSNAPAVSFDSHSISAQSHQRSPAPILLSDVKGADNTVWYTLRASLVRPRSLSNRACSAQRGRDSCELDRSVLDSFNALDVAE